MWIEVTDVITMGYLEQDIVYLHNHNYENFADCFD